MCFGDLWANCLNVVLLRIKDLYLYLVTESLYVSQIRGISSKLATWIWN